jgi:hypothetical protein
VTPAEDLVCPVEGALNPSPLNYLQTRRALIVMLQHQMAAICERSMPSLDYGDDPGRRLKIGRSYPVFICISQFRALVSCFSVSLIKRGLFSELGR